jgi:hypothetical protein
MTKVFLYLRAQSFIKNCELSQNMLSNVVVRHRHQPSVIIVRIGIGSRDPGAQVAGFMIRVRVRKCLAVVRSPTSAFRTFHGAESVGYNCDTTRFEQSTKSERVHFFPFLVRCCSQCLNQRASNGVAANQRAVGMQ